jgi:hypothetical protein
MAKEAQACGDKNTYEKYIAEIFEVVKQTDTSCGCGCSGSCSGSCSCGDCGSDCGCGETGPTWVNNIGIDIRSALQALGDLPAQVEALQTNVDGLANDVSALNQWTGIEEGIPGYGSITNAVNALLGTTASLGGQVNNNTGDITGLQIQVDVLNSEVDDLQEQITNLGSSKSEVAVYELMTNSGAQKSVWTATSGVASSSNTYIIQIPTNVTSVFPGSTKISFFNPTAGAWFYGVVTTSNFSGGSTSLNVSFVDPGFDDGASWQDSEQSFLVYKGVMTTSQYNFQTTLSLDNDAYWKFDTENVKYWSKIKASFVINEPTIVSTKPNFIIKNSTYNQAISLRGIPCGTIVDLELSFEKLYDQPTDSYNCVTLIDMKYNVSDNVALSDDGESLLFGGYTGFNPHTGYGIDLNVDDGTPFQIGIEEPLENSVFTQDVVNASGIQNTNRKENKQKKIPFQ